MIEQSTINADTINYKFLKKLIFFYFVLILGCSANIQINDVTYYDIAGNKTSSNNWTFYRQCKKDSLSSLIIASDYYKSGNIKMRGSFKSHKLKYPVGEFTLFYESGQTKSSSFYLNKKLEGKYIYYFENGQIDSYGLYQKGKKTGVWIYYFESGTVSAKIIYKKGKMIKENYWNENGSELKDFDEAFKEPLYPGGWDSFHSVIKENIKYPQSAQKRGISSIVNVDFLIDKEGNMIDIHIPSPFYSDLDKEALRVVNCVKKKWIPGKKFNRVTALWIRFPIAFSLNQYE